MQRTSTRLRLAHLIGKTLHWTEVGEGFEDTLSSPILSVHPGGEMFFVRENDEPRWMKPGPYVKDIRVVE